MKKLGFYTLMAAAMWLAVPAQAQDASGDRLTVNFSDPARPGLLKVTSMNGGISVKTHAGRDVIIDSKASQNGNRRRPQGRADGLRRIGPNTSGITVEEENNVMSITTGFSGGSDIEIQVPVKTNLTLKVMNGRAITVDGVDGEIEVNNANGDIILTNVSGSAVAHSSNGKLIASLKDLTPNKPMSFVSMNGDVDITLPGTAKANLKMRTDNGETYSDFDIQMRPGTPPQVERNANGRTPIQTDKTLNGTINGGGPDFDLRTFNGDIFIRKAK